MVTTPNIYGECTTTVAVYDNKTRTTTYMTSVNHYCRPEDVGFVKYLSETNVYNYRRRERLLPLRPVNDYFP